MRKIVVPLFALAILCACTPPPPRADRFRSSGEVIAFSGGDGGAARACFRCHGLKGEGDGRDVPRLAGLDPGYLQRQLDDYANGRRDHADMRDIARRLSGDDRSKVSAYYAQLPPPSGDGSTAASDGGKAARLYAVGDPARGVQACADCHGAEGEGAGPGNPALAGQPAPFVAAQLAAWRDGRRMNDPLGQMRLISRRLSEQEIRSIADHVSGLRRVRPPAARAASPAERRAGPRNGA